jgi:hypothetical protein
MMEGRVVLPLPPEMEWYEAAPVVLPGAERRANEERLLEAKVSEVEKQERQAKKKNKKPKITPGSAAGGIAAPRAVGSGGFGAGFGEPPKDEPRELLTQDDAALARLEAEKAAAKKALKDAQRKNDPELVAYARELRDRWQEHVSTGGAGVGMIENKQRERYRVGRLIAQTSNEENEKHEPIKRLDAA